ncbi:MAG: universal stress protein, partial [Bacteroidota bacterium]
MGTQGAASHDHKVLGSVAARVIAKAHCPVLAVPAEASFQPIEQIVYGLAFSEGDKNIIDFLLDFAQPMQASISCVHISTEPNTLEEVELTEYRDLYGSEQTPVYFQMVEADELLHALQETISQVKADVLVMNTRERDLLEQLFDPSLTRAMLMYADLPLLALHV